MRHRLLAIVGVFICAATQIGAQTGQGEATSRVRDLVRSLDPHTAYRACTAALERNPDVAELRAWCLVAAARADREAEALDLAKRFVEDRPEEGWAWFALAAAQLEDTDAAYLESPNSSARALELLGPLHDVVWLRAQALIVANRYEEAIEYTDQQWSNTETEADMLRQRSRALYYLARSDPDNGERAVSAAREAEELAPDSVHIVYGLGLMLQIQGAREEAAEYLARAQQMSPASIIIRQRTWRALQQRSDLDAAEKLEMLEADIDDLLEHQRRAPAALLAAHRALSTVEASERSAGLEEELLRDHADTSQAEWIIVSRYRAIRDELYASIPDRTDPEAEPDLEILGRYREALRSFLQRDQFHSSRLRGDAYRGQFAMSSFGDAVAPEELLEIVNGMVDYEGINPHIAYAAGAIALAERTSYYDRAEDVAKQGLVEGRKKVESQRAFYETQAEFDKSMDWMMALMHDALGWVYFQSDRIDDAEAELLTAYERNPEGFDNLHHLGQLYEYNGERPAAERYYVLGLNVDTPNANPNRAALETLYEHDRGSLEGFDAYLARIADSDAQARHAEILASRIENPEPPPPFELETLDGETVELDDLRGKIVVVNFWGIWCYWCVIELPELQQLHERYAGDPNVVVLTINNDPNPDQVPAWMEENGYTFPVVLDDGYVNSGAKIDVFPTTWFLDPDGRIAFSKSSWSQDLLQEYSWRVEAIRDGTERMEAVIVR